MASIGQSAEHCSKEWACIEVRESEATIEIVRERIGDAPVYVTFDLDCLDTTVAPGVANLEAGVEGLFVRDVMALLQGLRGADVIGGDVVCLMPTVDSPNQITSYRAMAVMFEMIGLIADRIGP